MSRGLLLLALVAALAGCAKPGEPGTSGTPSPGNAAAEIGGTWLPDASRAEPWPTPPTTPSP